MSRLIDADALIESIVNRTESETVLYNTTEELNAYLEGCAYKQNAIIDMINDLPTAYDIDKVVEQFEEIRVKKTCNKVKCDTKEICRICVVDDAIEIVKQGGVSGASEDICEWELKNACYTTSIKHYYSLPTSIVKTFNNCPYCGKKIKIVGDRYDD